MNELRASQSDVARRADVAFARSMGVRIGAEVEWLVFAHRDPTRPVTAAETARIAGGRLPAGGTVTIEPGGQVELVTIPHPGPRQLADAIEADTAVLARRFADYELALVPLGLDPLRPACRSLDLPRYRAMERYFSAVSVAGVEMMSRTASLQLNIDFGSSPATTWRRASAVAPVLAAAFANSPTAGGNDLQPISHRMRVWAETDRTRTRPVGPSTADWLPYVLDARVMLRGEADAIDVAPTPCSFGDWLESGDPPTLGELELHLTTLFPPLRPRRYLEFRMLDALPATGRRAAIAAVWALSADDGFAESASEVCRTIADPWRVVCEEGLRHSEMRAAAATMIDAAANSVRSVDEESARACEVWRDTRLTGALPADVDELIGAAEPTA